MLGDYDYRVERYDDGKWVVVSTHVSEMNAWLYVQRQQALHPKWKYRTVKVCYR